jgi:hypothetical protein
MNAYPSSGTLAGQAPHPLPLASPVSSSEGSGRSVAGEFRAQPLSSQTTDYKALLGIAQ